MSCKCLSRGRVSNCCFTILWTGTSPTQALQTQTEHTLSLPAFSAWSHFLVSHSSLHFFFFSFCCSSASKNVVKNKLTGQTTPRFPLTRVMWNDVFSSQQQKALDLRKELDDKDSIFQFYIWHKRSPNSCIMRRAFGFLVSSLLACSARFWRRCHMWWWIRVQGALHIQTLHGLFLFLSFSLKHWKIIFLLHAVCTMHWKLYPCIPGWEEEGEEQEQLERKGMCPLKPVTTQRLNGISLIAIAPGDKAAGTCFCKLNYTLMKIPGHSCKSRAFSGSWDAGQIPVKVTTLFPYSLPATSVNVVNCSSSQWLRSIPGMHSSLG